MYKIAIILYITCFSIYILFSRQPDYFDGELTKATMHFIYEKSTGKPEPYAFYTINKKELAILANSQIYPKSPLDKLITKTSEINRNQFTYTRLLHCYTINDIYCTHGLLVMCYDDEL